MSLCVHRKSLGSSKDWERNDPVKSLGPQSRHVSVHSDLSEAAGRQENKLQAFGAGRGVQVLGRLSKKEHSKSPEGEAPEDLML